MATAEHPRIPNGDGTHAPNSNEFYEVSVTLTAEGGASEGQLEDNANKILEAVEPLAEAVVLGPAVAWNILKGEIYLDFSVHARTGSELHQHLGLVMSIIEREMPIAREISSRTASAAAAACA